MNVTIRQVGPGDADTVVALLRAFAAEQGEASALDATFVRTFLAFPGCGALLAEAGGAGVGILSYCVRPDLYHAGPTGAIGELYVAAPARGRGIGGALLDEALRILAALGCREASISTTVENEAARRLYRAHGLTDESVLLERHFPPPQPPAAPPS